LANFRNGHTGILSVVTLSMNSAGSLARIFTTFQVNSNFREQVRTCAQCFNLCASFLLLRISFLIIQNNGLFMSFVCALVLHLHRYLSFDCALVQAKAGVDHSALCGFVLSFLCNFTLATQVTQKKMKFCSFAFFLNATDCRRTRH